MKSTHEPINNLPAYPFQDHGTTLAAGGSYTADVSDGRALLVVAVTGAGLLLQIGEGGPTFPFPTLGGFIMTSGFRRLKVLNPTGGNLGFRMLVTADPNFRTGTSPYL